MAQSCVITESHKPIMIDHFNTIFDTFLELKGDRKSGEDSMVLAGLARIGGQKFITIGYQADKNADPLRLPGPEGYRKSLRLISLAEAFRKPLVIIIDIPEYHNKPAPNQQRIDEYFIRVQETMLYLNIPILAIIAGIHNSIFSFELCAADRILTFKRAKFILQQEVAPNGSESQIMKAQDLMKLGLIDRIVDYPSDSDLESIRNVWQKAILDELQQIAQTNSEILIDQRLSKLQTRLFSPKSIISKA
jgi:acetyl-CoA carboxylase carboxyl transferase subunit alpha